MHGRWLLLPAPGCSWLLLAAPDCSWLLLAAPGSSWLLLTAPDCPWLLLAAPDCSWLLLATSVCSWLLLSAPTVASSTPMRLLHVPSPEVVLDKFAGPLKTDISPDIYRHYEAIQQFFINGICGIKCLTRCTSVLYLNSLSGVAI